MIFFVANDGTIEKSGPSPVFQGGEDAGTIYLVAPFAANAEVTAVFKLPNGELKTPYRLTPCGSLDSVINKETGEEYALWKRSLPEPVTRYYGEAWVQFYFHFVDKITPTSGTTFMVGRGVKALLPEIPTQNIYEDILQALSALRADLDNGVFTARSVYMWNVYRTNGKIPDSGYGVTNNGTLCTWRKQYDDGEYSGCVYIELINEYNGESEALYSIDYDVDEYYEIGDQIYGIPEAAVAPLAGKPTYGVGEVVFYPHIGKYGAFVKSIRSDNHDNLPYIGERLNSDWWAEVVNFNNITEEYFATLNEALDSAMHHIDTVAENTTRIIEEKGRTAEQHSQLALVYAQSAGASARTALDAKEATDKNLQDSLATASAAEQSALSASESAAEVQGKLDDLDGALRAAAQSVIVDAQAAIQQVIDSTDNELEEIRQATRQAATDSTTARHSAEASADAAAESARNAEDTLSALEQTREQLTAAQSALETALGYITRLEAAITEQIGSAVYKDGSALSRLNVSATPTAGYGALFGTNGNLKTGTPEFNADCVRVKDLAAVLDGAGFNVPITAENGEELVTEGGNVLQINLSF